LTRLTYPSASDELLETLAIEQFVDVLVNSDMRWRVFQVPPLILNDAVHQAVEFEDFEKAERRRRENQGVLRTSIKPQESDEKLDKITSAPSSLHSTSAVDELRGKLKAMGMDSSNNEVKSKSRPESNNADESKPKHVSYEKRKCLSVAVKNT